MRIIVCYYFRDKSISLGKDLAAALVSLGHKVRCFDSSARGSYTAPKRLAKSLAKLVGAKEQLSAYFSARGFVEVRGQDGGLVGEKSSLGKPAHCGGRKLRPRLFHQRVRLR